MNRTTYEVRQHPHSAKHLIFVVTTSAGRVYACSSAYEPGENAVKPNESTVRYAWKHGRYQFLPYDESTGSYC